MSGLRHNLLARLIALVWMLARIVAVIALSVMTACVWRNLRFWRWARRQTQLPESAPLVSILVPARNESATIAACIASLAAQDYARFEILALDDQSSDDTGAQLDALAERYNTLGVIHGTEALPPGWNGKSYACHRLAQQARGEWLLFTDADTVHTASSARRGIAQALALDADLLTAFTRQETGSWTERALVSFIVDFLPLVGLDFEAIWRGSARHVAGNGQYMLARAVSYHRLGGHAAIGDELVDDFALANWFYTHGYRLALVNGADMARCRMYHNGGEVWRGFSKNLMGALAQSSTAKIAVWQALLFAFGFASIFALPFVALRWRASRVAAALIITWITGLRSVANWFLQRPVSESLLTLPAGWGVMALGLNALIRQWRGQPVTWKGRAYGPAAQAVSPNGGAQPGS